MKYERMTKFPLRARNWGVKDVQTSVRLSSMSVRMIQDEYDRPSAENGRPVTEIASSHQVDPRLAELVPGFDAPFFQAGLAGYSDGAMRLVARAHDCPYCITEALLDLTLINGGKGRRKEDPDLIASECGMGDLMGASRAVWRI